MTGTKQRKATASRRTILIEQLVASKADRVDREAGILFHVKILGLESQNGRRYTAEAIAESKPLYEGRAVNVDHPAKPDETRSARDRFGWFENVLVESDGLYGDFHLLDIEDPLSRKLLNAAEQRPDLFGFSHNALGEGDDVDGVFVVRRITEVRSVDLVAEPATTKSLFESRNRTMKKLRAILEAVKFKQPKAKADCKALLEDDAMDAPLDMDVDTADEPVGDDGMGALNDAVAGVLKAGNHDLAMKIIKLIQKESQPEAPVAEADDDGEGGDEKDMEEGEGDDEEKDKKETKESRQPKKKSAPVSTRLPAPLDRALDLCEEYKIPNTKPFLKALVALTEDKDRRALCVEQKKLLESQGQTGGPRSRGPGPVAPTAQNSKPATDGESFAKAICR